MKLYKHILVATDFDEAAQPVLDKAKALLATTGAELSVVHVVEPLVGYAYVYSGIAEIEATLVAETRKKLAKVAEGLGVDLAHQHVVTGPTKYAILELGKKLGADLLVIGSHGRNGWGVVLGSTANAVLNGAEVDVLTVRWTKKPK